jgi:four helix bundle protein
MATITCFEDIESWKMAKELCKRLGCLIDQGRFGRGYRLVHQIEGSSGSIMDNIAEGFERGTRAEFIQFLGYAKGSCGELCSQLYRAFDRNYLSQNEFESFRQSVMNISGRIQNLISYLQKTDIEGVRKKREVKL